MPATSTKHTRPKVVTIGGGTGHFALLSGLKKHPVELTAIVTMSDDGGSTGMLRDELGVLPPGDLRQCLVALSDADDVVRKLFTHRFSNGSLKGHTFGNLFISALEQVSGSIDRAVEEAGRILHTSGTVLPVTFSKTTLMTTLKNGKVLKTENQVSDYLLVSKFGVKRMRLTPKAVLTDRAACAIEGADLIVLGPGNLYSSLLPNLLVGGMREALERSRGTKVFVVNLMNKLGHTDGFTCHTYLDEIARLTGLTCLDKALYNTVPIPPGLLKKYVDEGEPVVCKKGSASRDAMFVGADVLSATLHKPAKGDPLRRTLIRHDPDKLARAVLNILQARTRKL
jgi:uncharacterized cofD-like protein